MIKISENLKFIASPDFFADTVRLRQTDTVERGPLYGLWLTALKKKIFSLLLDNVF